MDEYTSMYIVHLRIIKIMVHPDCDVSKKLVEIVARTVGTVAAGASAAGAPSRGV